jgi:hypothetical protein
LEFHNYDKSIGTVTDSNSNSADTSIDTSLEANSSLISRSRTPSDLSGDGHLIPFLQGTHTPLPLEQIFNFESFVWNINNEVPATITMPPEYETVPFFFKNFIALPQQAESTRGFLEYLVPLYNKARPASVLHLATTAVAMATCGQYPGRQVLLREAVSTYGKALKKLNDDLKDPVMSKSDETVLAILMFSLYEVCKLVASARFSVVFSSSCAILLVSD